MDCEVAREALSARLDGEREAVPSHRVDEHLATCSACTDWYRGASEQAVLLRTLVHRPDGPDASSDAPAVAVPAQRWTVPFIARCAMAIVGVSQLGLAAAQLFGVHFGVVGGHHGASSGAHLLNESTAWSAALGVGLLVAAARPVFAAGVACVTAIYALGLTYYVAADTLTGQVTAARAASHLPIVAGALLAFTTWRTTRPAGSGPDPQRQPTSESPSLDALSERRRSKGVQASDGSAA